jgi:hypothetical protein
MLAPLGPFGRSAALALAQHSQSCVLPSQASTPIRLSPSIDTCALLPTPMRPEPKHPRAPLSAPQSVDTSFDVFKSVPHSVAQSQAHSVA